MLHPFINIFFLLAAKPLHLRVIMLYIEVLFTLMLTGTFTDSEVYIYIYIYIYIGGRTWGRCEYFCNGTSGNNGHSVNLSFPLNSGDIFHGGNSPRGHSKRGK